MGVGTSFTVCSLFFISLLAIAFFSRKRLVTTENRIYSYIIIASLIGTTIGFPCFYLVKNYESYPLASEIISKAYLVYLVIWLTLFTLYIFIIAIKNKNEKTIIKIFLTIGVIMTVIVCLLPIYFNSEDSSVYTYGPSPNFMYLATAIDLLIIIFCLIKNIKKINQRKFVPLIIFLIFGGAVMVIQKLNPELLLITFCEAFITFLMYFTIENPDVQMISELYKNKKIIEKTNEDNSKFMFRLTGDIKKPVKEIIDATNQIQGDETKTDLIEIMKYINNNASQLDYIINKILNINAMDTAKIKTFESKYNVHNLFKEITSRVRENLNESIKFECSISNSIPTYLYGDIINLKDAITKLIENAEKTTEMGVISLDVSAIVKYNICRLIINIEDTGKGMEIDKVNELLSMNKDIEDEEYSLIVSARKTIKSLGGNVMIRSEVDQGTTVTITLDQKIVETRETELAKKLDTYEQSLYGEKTVLLIDDDPEEIDYITTKLESSDVKVSYSLYERDCVEIIRAKQKYDLIILDDTLGLSSALNILNELKQIKGFKIPVVVMIDDNKAKIKLHYLQDGFADCLMKSKLDSELERIMKRF